jgi:hypothetical protein
VGRKEKGKGKGEQMEGDVRTSLSNGRRRARSGIMMEIRTFCAWSKDDSMVKRALVELDERWRLFLWALERQLVPSFCTQAKRAYVRNINISMFLSPAYKQAVAEEEPEREANSRRSESQNRP